MRPKKIEKYLTTVTIFSKFEKIINLNLYKQKFRHWSINHPCNWHGLDMAHCSYLDIYISREIRLCVVDLGGKFQTNLQAKSINFLVWKFRSTKLIFILFFVEFVKSSAFYTLFQTVDIFELWFDAKITSLIDVIFQIKKLMSLVWNLPSKSTTHSLIFQKM